MIDGRLPDLPRLRPCLRNRVNAVAHCLGTPEMKCPEWLKIPAKTIDLNHKPLNFEMKNGEFLAINRNKTCFNQVSDSAGHGPSKDDDCSESVKENENHLNTGNGILTKKRIFEHRNGSEGKSCHQLYCELKLNSIKNTFLNHQKHPVLCL